MLWIEVAGLLAGTLARRCRQFSYFVYRKRNCGFGNWGGAHCRMGRNRDGGILVSPEQLPDDRAEQPGCSPRDEACRRIFAISMIARQHTDLKNCHGLVSVDARSRPIQKIANPVITNSANAAASSMSQS
jgi:hypothetical protein